jgi:hypothetical protein
VRPRAFGEVCAKRTRAALRPSVIAHSKPTLSTAVRSYDPPMRISGPKPDKNSLSGRGGLHDKASGDRKRGVPDRHAGIGWHVTRRRFTPLSMPLLPRSWVPASRLRTDFLGLRPYLARCSAAHEASSSLILVSSTASVGRGERVRLNSRAPQ